MMDPASCSAVQSSIYAGADSLVASLAARGIEASRALAHVGDGLLHDRLSQCVRDNKTLTIKVLGGSMTGGSMNCGFGSGHICRPTPRAAWPALLRSYLSKSLNCRVMVAVHAYGGSTLSSALANFESMVAKSDDLVITDYTVNMRRKDHGGDERDDATSEAFLRRLQSLRAPPALVELEAWAQMSGPLSMLCTKPRLRLAQYYDQPMVSVMHAVCNASDTNSSAPADQFWRSGCGQLDSEGIRSACNAHPGPTTHSIYAALLAATLLRQAGETACQSTQRWAHSPLPLPLASASLLASIDGCPRSLARMNAIEGHSLVVNAKLGNRRKITRPAVSKRGWSFYADRVGKPGWIANASGFQSNRLSFITPVTPNGSVLIGYLRSYENMGRARVWLGNFSERAVVLDGMWDSRTSQTQVDVLPVAELLGEVHAATLRRTLHIEANIQAELNDPSTGGAGKFKVLSLTTC